jgi:hypothetical protein
MILLNAALQAWVNDYEREQVKEEPMSRSNPTEGTRNPSTRWFEWAGGEEGGYVRFYNKETKAQVPVEGAFTFLLLDELSTVKGWHEASESSIYSNEVRDTRQEVLVVRSFEGGELASGIYTSIRDRIVALGGHYCVSLYLGYKDGDGLKIGNLNLKGAAASALDGVQAHRAGQERRFREVHPCLLYRRREDQRLRAAQEGWHDLPGSEPSFWRRYRRPRISKRSRWTLSCKPSSRTTFKRSRSEAASETAKTEKPQETPQEPKQEPAPRKPGTFDDMEDDIPF